MSALVDVLCHLDDPRLLDRRAALASAFASGVRDVISAGVHPGRDEERLLDERPARELPRVWRAYGIHPQEAPVEERELQALLAQLERRLDAPDVVALGECGLDKRPGMPPIHAQERALTEQLKLARERGLPVIFHVVRASGRFLDLVEPGGPLPGGGVVHGYSGAKDVIPRLVALNLSLSFGHLLENRYAKRALSSARAVPTDRLLVETDAPEREPSALLAHVRALASLRNEPAEQVAAVTAANARRLFGLPEAGPLLAAQSR